MRAVVLAAVLCLTGCLPIYRQHMWESHPPDDTTEASFPGIVSPSLTSIPEGVDPKSWPPNPIKILIIHGMGNQKSDYADATIALLRTKLQLPAAESKEDVSIANPSHPGVDYGSLHIERYRLGNQ